jgi:hypothetical protein
VVSYCSNVLRLSVSSDDEDSFLSGLLGVMGALCELWKSLMMMSDDDNR